MAGHASTEFHLEIAHILFIDTVGYSKLLTREQREVQNTLNNVVHASERFQLAEAAEKLIRLPTGDGMALVFADSLESPIICAMEICRAIRDHRGLQLRMGIHSGPVTRLVDVNGQSNVAGGGMNMTERVMSCGDANHILLSKRAADDLAEYERWRPYLHDLGDCEGKHGAKLSLVNFYTEECGNPEVPARLKQVSEESPARHVSPPRRKIIVGTVLLLSVAIPVLYFFLYNSGRRATTAALANQKGVAVMPVAEKSIAVLPFENLSEKKSDANFANGVHDEILTNLAKVADLKVISRTSTMQYRTGMERNLREIGKALGTAHVVEGSVQRDGHRVRVSVQLIDARNDTHLWAESYDRDVADTFALESELAETIVAQLKAKLSPEEKAAIEEESTSDPLAHDLYLEANALISTPLFNVQGTENLFQAADLLEKAIARDPNYFQAYYQLASVHDQIYLNGPDHTPGRRALADAAVKAAQRLRPNAGETHLALAEHRYCGFLDYDGARRELELAERSLPNEPRVFELAGFIDRRQGRWDASTRNLLRALDLDPRNTYYLQQLAVSYYYMRRYVDQAAILDRALAILPSDVGLRVTRAGIALHRRADPRPLRATINTIVSENPAAAPGLADEWFYLALCERDAAGLDRSLAAMTSTGYSNAGFVFPRSWCEAIAARVTGREEAARVAFAAAREEVEKTLRDRPDYGQSLSLLGMIDAGLGRKEEAIREGRGAVELIPLDRDSINGALAIEYLAVTYAWTGEIDQALKQLKQATTIPSDVSYGQLRLHPFWDSLRGDPRFEDCVASLAPTGGNP